MVELIVLVTLYGPTLFKPFSRRISAASVRFEEEAPPEPATIPVRSFDTRLSVSFASMMASDIARYENAAASPINLFSFLSINGSKSKSILPAM